jgi:hypothetical protein
MCDSYLYGPLALQQGDVLFDQRRLTGQLGIRLKMGSELGHIIGM